MWKILSVSQMCKQMLSCAEEGEEKEVARPHPIRQRLYYVILLANAKIRLKNLN